MKTKSLSQTLNEAFESNINEASIDQYLEMISKDYQFDKKSDDYTGFLNTTPEDSGKYSSIAIELAENPKKYASALKKYGLSIKGATSKEEMVFVMESEEENVNESKTKTVRLTDEKDTINIAKLFTKHNIKYSIYNINVSIDTDDYKKALDILDTVKIKYQVNESSEEINENLITDFLSTLTSSEAQMLLGVIGATGLVLASVATDKIISAVKKKEGSAGAKLIEKLEGLGSSASSAVQNKN